MEPRGRPIGIWIIVILEATNAILALTDIVVGSSLSGANVNRLAHGDPVLRGLLTAWVVLLIIASVSLFNLQRRGWALMMLMVGLSLAANLLTWWNEPEQTLWINMTLTVIAAFYLNSAPVRRLFLTRHEVTRLSIGGRASE